MRRRRFRFGLIIIAVLFHILAFGPFHSLVQAANQDVRVVSSGDRGITLELSAPAHDLQEVSLSEGMFARLRVQGWATTSLRPGSPEMPVKGVLVQVPSSGRITIEATADLSPNVSKTIISPVPRQELSEEGVVIKKYAVDRAIYTSEKFLPEKVADVERIGIIRGVPVARVMFHPFQWNPATGELHSYRRIVARITFEGSLPSQSRALSTQNVLPTGEGFLDLLGKTIMNYRPVSYDRGPTESGRDNDRIAAAAIKPIKVSVKRDGIYRITGNALRKLGVPITNIQPATFRLLNMGNEIALRIVMKGKKFALKDYIEFYGKGVDNTFTDTNVYWLSWGDGDGKRMAVVDGTVTGGSVPPTSFVSTIRFEENHVVWNLTPGAPDSDYWFWERIDAPATKEYSFALPSVSKTSGTGTVNVCFRGRTTASPNPNHHTKIVLNGTVIGDATWDGDGEYVQSMTMDLALLNEGTNTLAVQSPGDTGAAVDTVYLNWFEVSYLRRFAAVGDELSFPLEGSGRVAASVEGLSKRTVSLYDITDPLNVAVFANYLVSAGTRGYTLTLEDEVAARKVLLAATDKAIQSPSSIEVWQPSNLKNAGNRADYILIAPREYLAHLKPLTNYRQAQGLKVKAVAVEDVYNEFSYGLTDPQAIKDFLAYAYGNWTTPAPTYVLLAGDATYDYRGYLGTGKKSMVPVHLSWTSDLGITPDDNWYVAVEGDDVLPEMIIGRIPAHSKAAATDMAAKIVNYDKARIYKPKEALFAADNDEASFETIDEEMIARLPAGMTPRRVYLSSYASVESATQDLIGYMNKGMMATTYTGHGDAIQWAGEGLFVTDYISRMRNGRKLTFIMTLDCLNGFFAHPSYYSIGESFVAAANRGAIASFSPSGLGYTEEHGILGNAVFSSMFTGGIRILGVITTGSKIDAFAQGISADLVKTFTLLGDPAVTLKSAD